MKKERIAEVSNSGVDLDDEYGQSYSIFNNRSQSIKNVWASNFQSEMKKVMKMAQKYHIIAMVTLTTTKDTEFPGMIKQKKRKFETDEENEYEYIANNADETKLIQLGLTIADEDGNSPFPVCTWQFNFNFNVEHEPINQKSEEILISAGIQFERMKDEGIDYMDFAQFFEASGFIYNKKIKWIVFHGASDFAYLIRLLMNQPLPETMQIFNKEMKKYFPQIYDLKYMIKDLPQLKYYGLTKLSRFLNIERIGIQHQAGSDSLLTLKCFLMVKWRTRQFKLNFEETKNIVFGIGKGYLGKNFFSKQSKNDEPLVPNYLSYLYENPLFYYQNNPQMMSKMNYGMYSFYHQTANPIMSRPDQKRYYQ